MFGVAEEELDGPRLGLGMRLGNHTLRPHPVTFPLRLHIPIPLKYPTPHGLSMGVSLEREKLVLRVEYRIDPFVNPTPAHSKLSRHVGDGLTTAISCL